MPSPVSPTLTSCTGGIYLTVNWVIIGRWPSLFILGSDIWEMFVITAAFRHTIEALLLDTRAVCLMVWQWPMGQLYTVGADTTPPTPPPPHHTHLLCPPISCKCGSSCCSSLYKFSIFCYFLLFSLLSFIHIFAIQSFFPVPFFKLYYLSSSLHIHIFPPPIFQHIIFTLRFLLPALFL